MPVHKVICDFSFYNEAIVNRGYRVQVVTSSTAKPTTTQVKEAIQAMFPNKKVSSVTNIKTE
jgi:hypothetical protein